jgi:uncharacterized membrane protein YdbT with pleckstrin-like domain
VFLAFGIGLIPLVYHVIKYFRQELVLTQKGLILKKGLIAVQTIEIPYTKINSVSTKKGMFGSLFGYGDILILSGNDLKGEVFSGIQEPVAVKEEILNRSHLIETGGIHNNSQISQQTENVQMSSYAELEELAKLKEKGIVTEEEFEMKKKQLLNI